MTKHFAIIVAAAAAAALLAPRTGARQNAGNTYALESPAGLQLNGLTAEPATHGGKKGVRLTAAPGAERAAVIEGLQFGDGTIDVELAGAPGEGAGAGARGFVGVAFRVQNETTFDAFYLRPTNGRAEDQERRNHAAQYISHPDWTWQRLRTETPSRYEAYVDLVPDVWTAVKVEVRGAQARLYVHGQPQPTLIVNDVKSGATARGGVGLWVGAGTVAHFRNLRVQP
jgi:hypothetical protein